MTPVAPPLPPVHVFSRDADDIEDVEDADLGLFRDRDAEDLSTMPTSSFPPGRSTARFLLAEPDFLSLRGMFLYYGPIAFLQDVAIPATNERARLLSVSDWRAFNVT